MCLDLLWTQTLRAQIWQKAREPKLHPRALSPLSKTFRNTSFDCPPPPSLRCQSPPSHPRTPCTYLSHIQFWNSSLISPISISNFRFVYRGDVQNQSYRRAPTPTQFKSRTVAKLEEFLDSALLSQVSDQLSLTKKVAEAVPTSQKKEVRDFDELKVLVDSDKEAVNVKDDSDLIEEFGNGGDGEACTPYRHFEQIRTRRFKGWGFQNTGLYRVQFQVVRYRCTGVDETRSLCINNKMDRPFFLFWKKMKRN